MLDILSCIDYRVKLYLLGFGMYSSYKFFRYAINNIHIGPFLDGPYMPLNGK